MVKIDIIHMLELNEIHYVCNHTCHITISKSSKYWDNVTCKKCLIKRNLNTFKCHICYGKYDPIKHKICPHCLGNNTSEIINNIGIENLTPENTDLNNVAQFLSERGLLNEYNEYKKRN